MKHHYLSLLLTLLMSMVTSIASAHNFLVNGIYYNITSAEDLTVEVTYKSTSSSAYSNEYTGSVTIPTSVTYSGKNYSVTNIGDFAFSGCSGLTSITIPEGVTSIGDYAFEYCSGLTSITVAVGNTVYDSRNNCNAIIETSSNTLIAGCQNTFIPEGVTSIGYDAFRGCTGLTSFN